MKHLPKVTLALVLVALVAFIGCRALARGAAAGVGAVTGSLAGPAGTAGGAAAGAMAGDALADALGADKEYTAKEYRELLEQAGKQLTDAHKTIAELQARKPLEVPVPVDRPFIPWWGWAIAIYVAVVWLARFASPRAREHIVEGIRDFLSLRWLSAAARVGAVEGLVHTETVENLPANAASPRVLARRRLRVPPPPAAPPTSQASNEELRHDA